jgi:hypothetical protein
MPAVDQTIRTLDVLVTRLHESHELSVYDSIERLVLVGEAVGFGADALVRMLDRGMGLEELLELIEGKTECPQRTAEYSVENKTAA